MSSLFSALGISSSGIDAMQTWIDTAGGNIANANDAVATTAPAYAEQSPVFTPIDATVPGQVGEGVATSVALGSTTGIVAHEPNSPVANAEGDVKLPDISTATQLAGLIEAQDGYQANTSVLQRAITAYQSGLAIGS